MFSERFDLRQPGSEFYPLWNDAIGRYQYLLRQGRPRIDVGILRTDHFVDNLSGMAFIDDDGSRVPDEVAYGTRWMRNRENHWWQDLGMQDAGWSYEFLDASLLLHDDVSSSEGLVQPDGPGYQALIVYQETLDPDAATLLLDWARAGLRVLIVNGARELKLLMAKQYTHHGSAASRTPGLDGRDQELADTLAALRTLSTVREIDDPAETVGALRALGVIGRAEFTAENRDVLTYLREDGDQLHLFAYHFLYETAAETTVEIALPGTGLVSRIDANTGEARPHQGVRTAGRTTVLELTLAPGESALLTLDRSEPIADSTPHSGRTSPRSRGGTSPSRAGTPARTSSSPRTADLATRPARSSRPRPSRTSRAPTGLCSPGRTSPEWAPRCRAGEYRAVIDLGEEITGRLILNLGSTSGGLGSVSVNGGPVRGFDTSHPVVDITDDVRSGSNEIVVRVASSLNNRLIARGYYDRIPDIALMSTGSAGPHVTPIRDYGLLGPVTVSRVL